MSSIAVLMTTYEAEASPSPPCHGRVMKHRSSTPLPQLRSLLLLAVLAAMGCALGCTSAEGDLFGQVLDSAGDSGMSPPDQPMRPQTTPDRVQTRAGVPVVVDVVANDSAEVLAKTLRVERQPAEGVVFVEAGSLRISPLEGFLGAFSLSYSVADDRGERSLATEVTVLVRPEGVRLPLEIFAGQTREVKVWLDREAEKVVLTLHRPVFLEPRARRDLGPKALVRLNSGPWQGITQEHVVCALAACLDGEPTARLELPVASLGRSGFQEGLNTLAFRMAPSDGRTTSYRVLGLDVRAQGQSVLETGDILADAPWEEGAAPAAASVAEGARLWHAPTPRGAPGRPESALAPGCGGCHAQDGLDLAYYHFSADSVMARAPIYGLDAAQGQAIADYIVDLKTALPASELRRPWNPPFQPGPGLDDAPGEMWAAGAGLAAVLPKDDDLAPYIFSGDLTQGPLRLEVSRPPRTVPISMQLPDWAAWLPELHPLQIFGDRFDPEASSGLSVSFLAKHFGQLRTAFEAGERAAGRDALDKFVRRGHAIAFSLAGPPDWTELDERGEPALWLEGDDVVVRQGSGKLLRTRREVAARALRHWIAVKLWDVHQRFDLASTPPPPNTPPYQRRWWGDENAIGLLSPQRTAIDQGSYADRPGTTSRVRSMQFGHLQLVLNAAPEQGFSPQRPVDWKQLIADINRATLFGATPPPPMRAALVLGAMSFAHTGLPASDKARAFEILHPGRLAPEGGYQGQIFYTVEPSLRVRVITAMLHALMDVLGETPASSWPRRDHDGEPGLESPEYTPVDLGEGADLSDALFLGRFADAWWTMIPRFAQLGVPQPTLERLLAFGQSVWPAADWSTLLRR